MTTKIIDENKKFNIIIMKDADRLVKEHPGWDINFSIAILACRYTKLEYRQAATKILEKRLKGTEVDPLLGGGRF